MKKLLLLSVLFVGCEAAPQEPLAPPKFREGQFVYIRHDNRRGSVLSDRHNDQTYTVRYSIGHKGYEWTWFKEWELSAEPEE